jgi:Flp pilus assembly protein TadG
LRSTFDVVRKTLKHMNEKQTIQSNQEDQDQNERGQSIVLIALALVGILAFAGIAIDVGFIFARGSQLQAAVDAAALAAVTELAGGGLPAADVKAGQFLNANGVPIATTEIKNDVLITTTMSSSTGSNPLGESQYSLTVTWPVELYFLKNFIDFENSSWDLVNLTRSATAAYFPLADIYASRRVESGVLSTSNQSLFGPHLCTDYGDPFSPFNSIYEPGSYTYHYRILIPNDYPSDVLRVELFDADSINQPNSTQQVSFSANAHALDPISFPLNPVDMNCTTNQKNPCLIQTGEESLVDPGGSPPVVLDQVNPFWFVRIDENRGHGTPPGDGQCGQPGSYTTGFNTATLFELFYYVQAADGTITKVPLAAYTGQTGDGSRDTGNHLTDMHWVSPGGTVLYDQPASVPVDAGSAKDFELSISADLPGILTEPGTGTRYIYLDVTAVSGSSENGFEVWAGPLYTGVSSNVNTRNIQVLNDPSVHAARGVTVYGMGRLPMNSNFDNAVDIPLIYVGPELAGQSILISLFDSDAGAQPPIIFYFDSISESDWSLTFAAGDPDPDGVSGRCKPGSCGSQWVNPAYNITIPGVLDFCDWNNPTQDDCTPFYGGRLMARYIGGQDDTYGWQINVTGLPYLIK